MTMTITGSDTTVDLAKFLFPETAARHRLPDPAATLVLPEAAEPAPARRPVTRVYLPALTAVERPMLGRAGEHRRQAPAWALLVAGAGLGLLGLAAAAGIAMLAVLA
jgi:hypothetical protein